MCPRTDSHLTYMIDIALTTEFILAVDPDFGGGRGLGGLLRRGLRSADGFAPLGLAGGGGPRFGSGRASTTAST